MKKQLFSIVMMLALVIVASSAFALNDISVYQGGKYHYRLNGVSSINAATATVSFVDANVQISTTSFPITANAAATSLEFDITYKTSGGVYPATGTGKAITVTVNDGTCSNYIVLNVTINAAPSMTITLASATTGGCQAINSIIPTDGSADAYAGGTNTVAFGVTTSAVPTAATFSYDLGVTSGVTLTTNPAGTKTAVGTFNAIFATTEGAGFTVAGAITNATFTMPAVDGGGVYVMTISGSPTTISYNALPTIGSFGN